MNYNNIYCKLIEKRKANPPLEGRERHHIIPKCIGGSDDPENLVYLTYREHYIAHRLLNKIHPESVGLYISVLIMSRYKKDNSKVFAYLRAKYAKDHSAATRDRWAVKKGFENYLDQCEQVWYHYVISGKPIPVVAVELQLAKANVRRSLDFYSQLMGIEDELVRARKKRYSEVSKKIRANISPEAEVRRIAATKAHDYTERNRKMSEARRGKNNPMYGKKYKAKIIACPHCQKSGGNTTMKRWHFDNCKLRKTE